MSSISFTRRTFLHSFFGSFSVFLALAAGTLAVGMVFWTNVYVAHAVSLKRLADAGLRKIPYAFDLNQVLVAPNFIRLGWILAIAIPALSVLMFARNQKLIVVKSTPLDTFSGKFLAILSVVILLLFPSSLGFVLIQWLKGGLDSGMLLGAYAGILLVSVFFISLSIAAASRIKNSWAALGAALFLCAALWATGLFVDQSSASVLPWARKFWPAEVLREFSSGILNVRSALIYISASAVLFFAAVLAEKRLKRKQTSFLDFRTSPKLLFMVCLAVFILAALVPFRLRLNLAESKPNFLSPHTENILKRFGDEKITVTVFLTTDSADLKNAESLLREYARIDPNFIYKIHDPDRAPAEALRHKIDAYAAAVIEAKGQKIIVSFPDEIKITNALSGILDHKNKRIIFVIGHAEPGLGDKGGSGYEKVAQKIKSLGYGLEESGLTDIHGLTREDLIMFTGQRSDLSDDEAEALRRHFESGGSVFIAADPVFPKEGMRTRELLWSLGVDFGRDVVIDKYSSLNGVEKLVLIVTDFRAHPSVRDFNKPVLMPVTRSVRKRVNVPDGVTVTEIARTGNGTWAETNLMDLENDKAELNPERDVPGPVPVVCVLEHAESKGKMAVAGDSEWLNNSSFELLGNREFFTSLLGWLMSDAINPEAASPSPSAEEPFLLHGAEHAIIFSASVFLTPVLLLIFGFLTAPLTRR